MGAKIKTKFDITDKILGAAEALDGVNLNVGVITGEHQWLAGIHEYGCKIPVTPKMRAYLHSIGVHLKLSTTEIVIPERSFLRSGYDKNQKTILNHASRLLRDVMGGKMSAEKYLETVGTEVRDFIKDYAIELSDPPKQPWPTRPEEFDNPLAMTGDMINGIEYEIER